MSIQKPQKRHGFATKPIWKKLKIFALISWIVFGLIIGALARLVLTGSDPMGWFATMALGIAGSVVGGFVASLILGNK